MPNGNEMSNELSFEGKIKDFTPEGQFLARQLYEACEKLEDHNNRLKSVENRDKKMLGISGVASAVISAIISYFTK